MNGDDLNEIIDSTRSLIAEHGWAVQGVGAGDHEPQFAYTVGLTALGHPEIIIEALPALIAQGILNHIGGAIRQGTRFEHGDVVRGLLGNDLPLAFITADNDSDLTLARRIYERPTALQAVWCDRAGHFPWDLDYGMAPTAQPILGEAPERVNPRTI